MEEERSWSAAALVKIWTCLPSTGLQVAADGPSAPKLAIVPEIWTLTRLVNEMALLVTDSGVADAIRGVAVLRVLITGAQE